jgi:hypothetical protein
MYIKKLTVFTFLLSCKTSEVVTASECSEQEQNMFLTCVEAGCSASYEQDLSGKKTCDIDSEANLVSVKAGGECAFTTSGSCYVICSCPDGVSFHTELSEIEDDLTENLLLDRIELLENSIQLLISDNQACQQNISSITEEINNIKIDLSSHKELTNNEFLEIRNELDVFYISTEQDIQTLYDIYDESNLVVSQYDVLCYDGINYSNPYYYWESTDNTYSSFYSFEYGCTVANVDINDLPYFFSLSYITDNNLEYPTYSRSDSFARYGADRPDLYRDDVNWGNDLKYTKGTFFGDVEITSTGQVISRNGGVQADNTIPGSELRIYIPLRVTIIHNKSYSAP